MRSLAGDPTGPKRRMADDEWATSAVANLVSQTFHGLEVSRERLKSALLKKKSDTLMKLFDIKGDCVFT